MKNIVFILNIKLNDKEGRYTPERSLPYKFSIDSWKAWCDKNNCELLILDELLVPKEHMGVCWQRYYLFEILKANNVDFDQVLLVDSDTIVHPDTPNFFNMTEGKYVGVHNEGSYDWIFRSIENYSKYVFSGRRIEWWRYINGGFQIVNKKHESFFKSILTFYEKNFENLAYVERNFHVGTDQTPLNFLLQANNIDLHLLPYEYNMVDMARKELLNDNLTMTKMGWIYHFNSIPNNNKNKATYYWMEKVYNYLYR